MSENPQEPQSPQQPGPPPQQPQPGPSDAPAEPGPAPYQGQQPYPGQPQPGQPYPGQPGPAYGPGGQYQPQPLNPSDERMWSVFAQIGPFLLGFIAPLVIWLVLKDRSRFVDQEAKESLNFQITLVIALIAAAIITAVTFGIGGIVYLAFIAAIVFMILAAVANGKGAPYRYPVNIRFVK
ncbi:hypothetical protein C8K30_105400 [Promicromonospora sp. AC04]|uniref:DUF4870 domain-containing protein n=1 Tax=Promicromonospora sp. AC04 TaxID=2135723 RepID=UPI000D33A357|nr:DUF4870 domain-containing protein [Promicromonospora sp. AC04]PUB27169.1 hypothetical protein C8K30_105400 [Promicromonospora sp. AC04]